MKKKAIPEALEKAWQDFYLSDERQLQKPEFIDLVNLVGRRLLIADYDRWLIGVLDPVFGRVEPAIGDYFKYIRSYLFFYSDGSPKARRSSHSAFRFCSRLWQLLKRFATRSWKPLQLWAESSIEMKMTPRASGLKETSCVAPQSGHSVCESCNAHNSNAD